MKILAFAASSSSQSINKILATYAAHLVADGQPEVLDLNDYEMPIYSSDREQASGIPEQAKQFYAKIADADAVIIAFAEHNGSYTAAYKNLFDWTSRIDMKVYQNKPVLLLATSPGPGGAASVLNAASGSAPYFAMDVKAQLSIPSFFDQFDMTTGKMQSPEWQDKLLSAISQLI